MKLKFFKELIESIKEANERLREYRDDMKPRYTEDQLSTLIQKIRESQCSINEQ